MTSEEIQKAFREPFPLACLGFRPQSAKNNRAIALPYIDARDVQNRLDDVVGVGHWQDEYTVLNDGSVLCRLKVRIGDEWVVKEDVGSPSEQPDAGDRLKAAVSDALKRAAIKYGIGRYIYSIPTIWGDYDPNRKQFTDQFLNNPGLPFWALPAGQQKPQQPPLPAQRPPQQVQQPQQQPQQQRPPQTQPQQPQQGDATAGAVSALTSSASVGELKAAMDVAKLHIQNGRIGDDGKAKVAEAVRSRLLNMVRECQSKPQLDAFFAEYTKLVVPVVTEASKTHADVREAANAKLALLEANNTENVDLFA